ncbi:MAG: hypothetical protein ACRC1P_09695 [Cellulosilyticaceae bacterium]
MKQGDRVKLKQDWKKFCRVEVGTGRAKKFDAWHRSGEVFEVVRTTKSALYDHTIVVVSLNGKELNYSMYEGMFELVEQEGRVQ